MRKLIEKIDFKNISQIDLAIYALFIAVFKIYTIPQGIQQMMKLVLLVYVSYFIIKNVELKKLFNMALPFSGIIVLSSILGYFSGTIRISSVAHGVLHAGCIYLIYTLVRYCGEMGYYEKMSDCIYKITSIFCVISLVSMLINGHSPNGTEITYFFGYKFMTSYYFMMWLALFRVRNNAKIMSNNKFKMQYLVLAIMLVGICKWLYCTTAMVASVLFVIELFIPQKMKKVLMNPYAIICTIVLAGIIPFIIEPVMELPFVQYVVTEVLHKHVNLTGRIAIFNSLGEIVSQNFLWGYGYGNTAVAQCVGYGNAQNGLMQLLVDYGIFGGIAFGVALYACLKKKKNTESLEGYYLLLYGLIVCSIVEISYNYIFYLILFVIGCYEFQQGR